MRAVACALALLALAVMPASADEPPDISELKAVSERAKPLRDSWERCTALAARRAIRSAAPPAGVADAALRACKREEAAIRAFLARQVGRDIAARAMVQLRGLQRSNLILVIEALRDPRR